MIAEKIDATAERIDITLAGRKYTRKTNTSSVILSQYVTWTEGGMIRPSTDFNVDLRLPNLERRWQLRFASYNEEEENRNLSEQRVRTRPRPRDYGASVAFFEKLGRIKTTFQPRFMLKDPVEVSYLLRFESQAESRGVRLFPRFELFAHPEKGTGEFFSLELVIKVGRKMELSWQNTEEYRERGNVFDTQHGVSLDYSLTPRDAVGASVTGNSTSRPAFHLDTVTLSTVYAHEISEDRLRYSLTPFLAFTKGKSFNGDPGVSLNVALVL
jgi:hypothetical protein